MAQRWALLLQYDGTEFAGSQWQPNSATVQGALQTALESLTSEPTAVSMAGRTDAGVHATGQVASFVSDRSPESMPAQRWVTGLNHFLPASVAVQAATSVPMPFDPRRDAISRTYHYALRIARQRQPLWERRAWVIQPPFDAASVREVCSAFIGEHDFAAFTRPTDERSTIRTMHSATLERRGETLRLSFSADSFLQHQVRRMVGAVVEVARGRVSASDCIAAFHQAAPGSMGPTAPACGLSLSAVHYDPPLFGQLECQQQEQTT